MKELTLAYSPCPNDTFLFYHFVKHTSLDPEFRVQEYLMDVEELNHFANHSKFHITKLSYACYFEVVDRYQLLNVGSALGRGCGPILIKRKGTKNQNLMKKPILVPGLKTTANLLLNLYLERGQNSTPIRYDRIIPALINQEAEFGVIIHEERFLLNHYPELEIIMDLGDWWEKKTNLPIPLGGIFVQRNLGKELKNKIERRLSESLEFAYNHREEIYPYIFQHSQTLSQEVVDAHIGLYVNDFTKNLGEEGKSAILELFKRSRGSLELMNQLFD